MSLGKLLHKSLGVALDAPVLRALSGEVTGHLIASTVGPAYQAIHDHFTLSGRDLAAALSDSFGRGLAAIDDELNGWRISNAFGSRLRRDYQVRVRRDFLEPYIAERALDETARTALRQILDQHRKQLIQAREQAAKKWTMPVKDWKQALNRFAIQFDKRMPQ